jgi:alanine racemase
MEIVERRSVTAEQAMSVHPSWRELDLAALRSNLREVRRRVGPDIKIIASLKANAYGHGVVPIARALADLGVYALATGSFEDALALRRAGIDTKIQMFGGNLPAGAADLLRLDLMPTVYNLAAARAVSAAASAPARVYVKVDCGLGRLGVPVAEAGAFVKKVAALPRLVVEGVYTHLPFADRAGRDWARRRLEAFHGLIGALARAGLEIPVTQAIASAGVASDLAHNCNAVCTGHLLYGGLSVVAPDVADLSAFRPVLHAVKTRLIHVGDQPSGQRIFVGGQHVPERDTTVGVVPVGLFDGLRKPTAGKAAAMLIRGRRVPLLSVSLEYSSVDLTGVDRSEIGEEVVVLGRSGDDRITLEEMADWQGTSALAVLMSFDQRLPCRLHGTEPKAKSGYLEAV